MNPNGGIYDISGNPIATNGDGQHHEPISTSRRPGMDWRIGSSRPAAWVRTTNSSRAYAFVAVPIGNAPDLNAIIQRCEAARPKRSIWQAAGMTAFYAIKASVYGKINLAALLADLNTNQWDPPTVENAVE